MMSQTAIVLLCLVFAGIDGLKLPTYFKKCSKDDPNLAECIKVNGNAGLPEMLKGDKKYKLPNMLPFRIDSITIEPSPNLILVISNAEVFGLEGTEITEVKVDMDKKTLEMTSKIPKLQVVGEYDINGRIMILPIQGKGPTNITLIGGSYTYAMEYVIKDVKGVEYYEIIKKDCDYKVERMHFEMDNLFNGDSRLGSKMLEMLNENWEDVSDELKPGITAAMSAIITSIVGTIIKQVPADEMF